MNIEQLTQVVMAELQEQQYLNYAHQAQNVPHKRILIVLTRSDLPLQEIQQRLSPWQKKATLKIVAPQFARGLWGNALKEFDVEYVSFESGKMAQSWVSGVDRVALLGCTRPLLQKICSLKREHLISGLVSVALERNKPVMCLDDQWEQWGRFRDKLSALGVHCAELSDIARIFPIAPLPAPAPAAVSAPHSNRMCQSCDQQGHCVTVCSERMSSMLQAGVQRISTALGVIQPSRELASMIDHTLLKAEATEAQVRTLCQEARDNQFASVCINPSYVPLAAEMLKGSGVMVCTVIGFPLGATDTATKANETQEAIANGADEIDMVINVGALKSKNDRKVEADIRAVVEAAGGHTVKVILETALLNDEEKVRACKLSEKAGAHFVKTSTGFGPSGATAEDIALMRRSVRPDMEVKASGGIRDQEKALQMIQAGATRIGASASVAIVRGENAGAGKY